MSRTIGFIGLGIMGDPMARRLIAAGHRLTVYNRTAARCAPLVELGARVAVSPREAAWDCEVVISIVSDSADVEDVLLGSEGAIHGAAPGALFVDMSTIAPDTARRIGQVLQARQIGFLDAPVTGGDAGARAGTLSILVGGEDADLARMRCVFEVLGKRITHCGGHGAGQAMKACNQVLVALNLVGVVEALALGRRNGLDLNTLIGALSGGAGSSFALERLAPLIVSGDFSPGFAVRLLQKDLRIVQAVAASTAGPLSGVAVAQRYFAENERVGESGLGIQAMSRALERLIAEGDKPSPEQRARA